jgi:putative transposase
MAGNYSQIYLQFVFVVKRRQNLLQKPWRDEVFKYMNGIIKEKGQRSIIVNGVSDHVHVFVGYKPSMNMSDLVRDIKNNSSRFINQRGFTNYKFAWQEGYAVFSYSKSEVDNVYRYIANQENHHRETSFRDEYIKTLEEFEIEYDTKYLFEFLD